MNPGRIAGKLLAPLGFTALTYGIGKLSGQDDQRALMNAIAGVGGAYAGEWAGKKVLPQAALNFEVKGKPVHFSGSGLAGSIAGGWAGTALADQVDRSLRGNQGEGGEINPLLLGADDFLLPAFSVAKAFI